MPEWEYHLWHKWGQTSKLWQHSEIHDLRNGSSSNTTAVNGHGGDHHHQQQQQKDIWGCSLTRAEFEVDTILNKQTANLQILYISYLSWSHGSQENPLLPPVYMLSLDPLAAQLSPHLSWEHRSANGPCGISYLNMAWAKQSSYQVKWPNSSSMPWGDTNGILHVRSGRASQNT